VKEGKQRQRECRFDRLIKLHDLQLVHTEKTGHTQPATTIITSVEHAVKFVSTRLSLKRLFGNTVSCFYSENGKTDFHCFIHS